MYLNYILFCHIGKKKSLSCYETGRENLGSSKFIVKKLMMPLPCYEFVPFQGL